MSDFVLNILFVSIIVDAVIIVILGIVCIVLNEKDLK